LEIPSTGVNGTAYALAKLAAYMANQGTFEGKTILSLSAWEEMHSEPVINKDALFNIHTSITKGGLGKFGLD
jgi:hypothetical protein